MLLERMTNLAKGGGKGVRMEKRRGGEECRRGGEREKRRGGREIRKKREKEQR